jgi:hypothetical protein
VQGREGRLNDCVDDSISYIFSFIVILENIV